MSSIRVPLAFLLLLSTCFVYYALKTDLTMHDIAPLTKRAYNDSDGDWVRYLSARRYDREPPRGRTRTPRTPPPRAPTPPPPRAPIPLAELTCDSEHLVAGLWRERGPRRITYGQGKDAYDIPFKVESETVIIRSFTVSRTQERDMLMRANELDKLIQVGQLLKWGREVIAKDMEMWYAVQGKMGDPAETLGDKLPNGIIPTLQAHARERYKRKYNIRLPKKSQNEGNRYVYWQKNEVWYGEIVGWYGEVPTTTIKLPAPESVCIAWDHH